MTILFKFYVKKFDYSTNKLVSYRNISIFSTYSLGLIRQNVRHIQSKAGQEIETPNDKDFTYITFSKEEVKFLNETLYKLSPVLKKVVLLKYKDYEGFPYALLEYIQSEKEIYEKDLMTTRSRRLRADYKKDFYTNVVTVFQEYIQLSLSETLELVDILTSKKKETKKRKTKPSIPSDDQALSNDDTLSNDETISSFDEEKVSSTSKKRSSKGQKKPKTSKRSKKSKNLD